MTLGVGGWLIIFEYYRLAIPSLSVFRAGVITVREWIASLGSWKGVVEQRSSCDSDVGMCVSHSDSGLVIACLGQHLKISLSIPTEGWMFAADTTLKAIPLTARKKNEPWHFAVLQVNEKLNGNASIPFPSHRLISVFKWTLIPKCFSAPIIWETHTNVV